MTIEEYNRLCLKMIERINSHDEPLLCIRAFYDPENDALHTLTPEAVWTDL